MDAARDTQRAPRTEQRDPPSLFPAALAASVAGISITYVLPFLVGSLMDGIGLDARHAGLRTSAEMGAMALILAVPVARRVERDETARAGHAEGTTACTQRSSR
jgi:hypothetical protein